MGVIKLNTYGYARVSSTDQNAERQLIALLKNNVEEKIFIPISNRAEILKDRNTKSLYQGSIRAICFMF